MLWCFLGIFGDRKGQNLNIFLKVMEGKRLERWSAACLSSCPLGAGVSGSWGYFADVSKIVLMLPLFGVFPAFYRSALGALLANMALFRVFRAFLARFYGFVWVCVGSVLCVACAAFVRVWS